MGDIAGKVRSGGEGIEGKIAEVIQTKEIDGKEYQIVSLKNGKRAVYAKGLKEFSIFGGGHDLIWEIYNILGGILIAHDKGKGWGCFTLDGNLVFGGYHRNALDISTVCGGTAQVYDAGKGIGCFTLDGELVFGGYHESIGDIFDVCGGIAEVEDNEKQHYISYDGKKKYNEAQFHALKGGYHDLFIELNVFCSYSKVFNQIYSLSLQAKNNTLLPAFKNMIDTIVERYKNDKVQLRRHLVHDFGVVEKALTRDIMKYMDCGVVPDG